MPCASAWTSTHRCLLLHESLSQLPAYVPLFLDILHHRKATGQGDGIRNAGWLAPHQSPHRHVKSPYRLLDACRVNGKVTLVLFKHRQDFFRAGVESPLFYARRQVFKLFARRRGWML